MYVIKNLFSGFYWTGEGWGSKGIRYGIEDDIPSVLVEESGAAFVKRGFNFFRDDRGDPSASIIKVSPVDIKSLDLTKMQEEIDKSLQGLSDVSELGFSISARCEGRMKQVFIGVYRIEENEWEIY